MDAIMEVGVYLPIDVVVLMDGKDLLVVTVSQTPAINFLSFNL